MITKRNMPQSAKIALIAMVFLTILTVFNVFAAGSKVVITPQEPSGMTGLETILSYVLGFFTSGYMKAILAIALGGLGCGMIMNRGEPGMVKKFIPWVCACVLLLSMQIIVELIWEN